MKNLRVLAGIVLLIGVVSCDDDDSNDNNLERADERFVEKVALGNMTEVEFGALASTQGNTVMVRSFGSHMVTEHNTAQTELKSLGQDFDNVNWPTQLDQKHQQLKQQLASMKGRMFDSAYMQSQVMDHQMTVQIFQNELDSGKNERVRSYANKYLPHIKHHLQKADSTLAAVLANDDDD